MLLREATHDDIPAIARVHVDAWRTTYRGIFPDELLQNMTYQRRENGWLRVFDGALGDDIFTYVVENQLGQIIGFANGGLEREGNSVYPGELFAIYILEAYQRQGIGCELMQAVAYKLAQMNIHTMLVWVLEDNPACRFYEAIGGQRVYQKDIERGGAIFTEVAYGWTDTSRVCC
ncbi:gcn5-related n-acetyltransferase [Leptolyngbya sp. Heron Island J]|uniref:GNAT family N-acetyltransferase n=1 Tax=Leptolyngbya sp. Heron Island J TaxID=1385935 RepID=UPI0003B9567B|nr:GNAT family N-acetyltransferase [Leptolyngbya sp. Heron Island J]ESA33964.1 gcn5-related n-acetyltransferase [Leptolyngbya sp. Heron Island J]